ncbi:MAG: FtsW/RodA/SpoVE family cell cycle protein [Planctomycetota bacterium]
MTTDRDLLLARQAELDALRAWILGAAATLAGLGLVLIYSASAVRAEGFGWELFFVERQVWWLAAGLAPFALAWRIDYRWIAAVRWPLLLFGLGALVAVLVPGIGHEVNGARRWFRVAGYSIQPSEAAKVVLVAAMAGILARMEDRLPKSLLRFLVAMGLALGSAALVAMEPDLGTAVLLATVLSAMVFAAGARLVHLAAGAGLALAGLAVLLAVRFDAIASRFGYVWDRVLAWHEGDVHGKGYHAYMSVQALKSGGTFGMAPGRGWAKLGYLPEAHTDFIFAVAGQELGLAGTAGILLVFAVLIICGMRLVRVCPDGFGSLLAFGITLLLGLQAAFNIAVVTGATPTKGISLPFVSFGGSGLVCSMTMLGLLASITRHAYGPHLRVAAPAGSGSAWGAHLLAGLVRGDSVRASVQAGEE